MKVITFSIAAKHLLLISPYTLRVQCLELWIPCILLQYPWDKGFHNSRFSRQNNHYDSVRLGVVYLNLVFSRANRVRFCEICLQFVAHITTIYLFHFQVFFFLTSPRCPILHHRSCILGQTICNLQTTNPPENKVFGLLNFTLLKLLFQYPLMKIQQVHGMNKATYHFALG